MGLITFITKLFAAVLATAEHPETHTKQSALHCPKRACLTVAQHSMVELKISRTLHRYTQVCAVVFIAYNWSISE